MATVTDITTTTLSGLNHIDALLDTGPDWNYLTPVGNVLRYTFSVASGTEAEYAGKQQAMSALQQANARAAINYVSQVTGIEFVETTDGAAAQIHLCDMDISDPNTTGLCSWNSSYSRVVNSDELVSYSANAYVYLDNREWANRNASLAIGTDGYETLLHELGHALGLKHPFDGTINLPLSTDNTSYTLMSYNDVGAPHTTYSQYDIAALNWIYGKDGLGGDLGLNSATGARYFTGTSGADTLSGTPFNDTLEGDGGNDMINGGDGIDTAVFRGAREDYTLSQSGGDLVVTGALDGSDILRGVEILQFSNGSVSAQAVDTTPPAAPTMSVTKNANGYVVGDTAFVVGIAEANSKVSVYTASGLVGTAQVDGLGFWSLQTTAFADGLNYAIFAKATDAAGNVSASSANITFNVDSHAPVAPTGTVTLASGGNQPVFSGTGEAGTAIQLINGSTVIGETTVGSGGTWTINANPLPNASYSVSVVSTDKADNATDSASKLSFTVNSTTNMVGTAGNDKITATAGNNAIDGLGGIDTVVFATAHTNFTVAKATNGFTVTDNVGSNGTDSLINVERIQFSDNTNIALDIAGVGGQAYRLYQAAFDRKPDMPGLGFWIKYMDAGLSLNGAAAGFMDSPEFINLYGSSPTDLDFINRLYHNVLHRDGEQSGVNFWLNAIEVDHHSRAEVLAFFAESPENQAAVIGSIQNGIEYTPIA